MYVLRSGSRKNRLNSLHIARKGWKFPKRT
nr:MAG TPA: hypothetical protein [Caudoviricetes sp.]